LKQLDDSTLSNPLGSRLFDELNTPYLLWVSWLYFFMLSKTRRCIQYRYYTVQNYIVSYNYWYVYYERYERNKC